MDFKLKRKEIIKKYYPISSLIGISALGGMGVLFLYFSGIFGVRSLDILYNCVYKNEILIIFGVFFLSVFLYCLLRFFLNIIIKPKKEVLYLYRNEHDEVYFINRKGRRVIYNENNLKDDSYYNVLMSHDYVYEVLGEAIADWIPIEKKSYWSNFYSPNGNFEYVFLLPIVYFILVLGLLIFFMSEGFGKVFGLIWCGAPIYFIVYDLIYKIKLKDSNYGGIDEVNFYESYGILKSIVSVGGSILLCIVLMTIFFKLPDFVSKLIFSPFLGCGLCSFGLILSKVFNNKKLQNIFWKSSIIIFLTYWFGFLSFWTFTIFKQGESILYLLISIPFWISGFLLIYNNFIKNK